jgi:hypothetical protein
LKRRVCKNGPRVVEQLEGSARHRQDHVAGADLQLALRLDVVERQDDAARAVVEGCVGERSKPMLEMELSALGICEAVDEVPRYCVEALLDPPERHVRTEVSIQHDAIGRVPIELSGVVAARLSSKQVRLVAHRPCQDVPETLRPERAPVELGLFDGLPELVAELPLGTRRHEIDRAIQETLRLQTLT